MRNSAITALPARRWANGERGLRSRPGRSLRTCSLAFVLCLAACAGSQTRIASPPAAATRQPLIGVHGVVDEREERTLIARALEGTRADADETALLEGLRRHIAHTSLVAGNRVTLLTDGPSTFSQFARAIAEAGHHIHVETFIFSDDGLGRSFAALLAEKARQGVEVRVIYDSVGSWAADDEVFRQMREAGVQVRPFAPLSSVDTLVGGRLNQRDHRKLLIVDGSIAFVGGINISGTYNLGSSLKPGREEGLAKGWRDTQVRIAGPVVQQFQALFFATWARAAGGTTEVAHEYFPPPRVAGPSLVAARASAAGMPDQAAIHAVHLAAAAAARRRLWITQAYFAPDTSLRDALIAAARRGVDVRVLVPGFSDSQAVLNASRAIYAELLRGQVRVFEFDAAFIHAKTMVIDDSVSLVGSANMDYRSAMDNDEVTALLVDSAFSRQLAAVFERDLLDASEVTLQQWRHRSVGQRVLEQAATLLWPWL